MPDSPNQETGDGLVSLPTIPPEDFDVKALLANLVQTEAGSVSLAEALKDRHICGVLKQHGVKIRTDNDVGYSSLPFELRDNIRKCAIATVQPEEDCFPLRCRRCPRLAPYACIDSEWRHAVESTTFRRLSLQGGNKGIKKDLALFESYVVGSRRKYLQYICLPTYRSRSIFATDEETETTSEEERMDQLISPIRQLFNCVEQWHARGTGYGNLCVEIQTTASSWGAWVGHAFPMSLDRVYALLNGLPTTPQITQFCTSLWGPMGTRSMLALLSRMPNLQSATINLNSPGQPEHDNGSEIQVFFDSLAQTVPRLEALEVKCRENWHQDDLQGRFCTTALSFSQRLRKISFTTEGFFGSPTFSILAAFSTSNFDPDAPPPLVWPNLTHFKVAKWHVTEALETPGDVDRVLNEFMLTVGRAIRYMPRIRNLEVGLTYDYRGTNRRGSRISVDTGTNIVFNLESLQDAPGHSPLAKLSVTHHSFGWDLTETIPSEEVRYLWKESLLHSANATLEVEVISKDIGGRWGSAMMQFMGLVT